MSDGEGEGVNLIAKKSPSSQTFSYKNTLNLENKFQFSPLPFLFPPSFLFPPFFYNFSAGALISNLSGEGNVLYITPPLDKYIRPWRRMGYIVDLGTMDHTSLHFTVHSARNSTLYQLVKINTNSAFF